MMKLKNRAIALSLAGAVLFTTAAAADILSGDAYTGAKDAIKNSARFMADGEASFTLDYGMSLKIDGETYDGFTAVDMYDTENRRSECMQTNYDPEGTNEYWNYQDSEKNVSKRSGDDTYYISHYGYDSYENDENSMISNPFEDDIAPDIEKVFDAFVGSLKEFVQAGEENGDKIYYGELDASQIPALPNTLCAFIAKVTFNDEYSRDRYNLPELSDICIDSVSGKLTVNSDDVVTGAYGAASLVGTDKSGGEHTIEFELYYTMSDIGKTVVPEFATDGKTIHDYEDYAVKTEDMYVMDSFDIGTYKCTLLKRGETAYEKAGEITLTVDSVDGDEVSGTYVNTLDGTKINYTAVKSEYGYDYYSENEADNLVISKIYDWENEVSTGVIIHTGVMFDSDGGWSSNDTSYSLSRVID